jgi:3-hydroxyisobutyrate dehydrogenase-like beta-hydroxyacid dehydrogenase/alkylhydroperoxidase/carboxymuconolactone decarboxylase family protein YurZ
VSAIDGSGETPGRTIGFVGLGNMGEPMVRRLAAAGHTVLAFDVAEHARARLADAAGVTITSTAADVASGADVVILMLPDSSIVEQVLLTDGLLDRVGAPTLVVDMSSSEPTSTRALAERAAKAGVTLIDAPVSGGVVGARSGSLTIMAGGPAETLEALRPVLGVLGSNIVHAGQLPGAGHAVKALNNLMSAAHLLASAEAILTGQAFGVDPAVMVDIVNGSSGRSGSTQTKWPRYILPGTFDSGFSMRFMVKDMNIALHLAEASGVPAPISQAAVAAWTTAADEMPPGADHTEIARWLGSRRADSATSGSPAPDGSAPETLTPRQQQIKDEFIAVRGTWSATWEKILELDAEFLASYLEWSAVPVRKRQLEPKVREFVFIAADSAATHLYEPGIRQHIRAALDLGASAAEVMEVLELTSTLGIHAGNIGIPVLIEVLTEEGKRDGPAPLSPRQQQLKAEFAASRGYWHEFWDGMLELDQELFAAYLDFSSVPWRTGVLEPKVKELIYIAFDASATHLYVPGLKLHMRNAVRLGATSAEIIEVLEIVSVIGIHAATVGVPILAEELAREADD